MPTPYGLDIIESCVMCKLRSGRLFCNLPEDIVQAFESLRTTVVYPRGSMRSSKTDSCGSSCRSERKPRQNRSR
jgi:hypothetical protein